MLAHTEQAKRKRISDTLNLARPQTKKEYAYRIRIWIDYRIKREYDLETKGYEAPKACSVLA